ncbi:hypothetical protein [Pseudomonas sp. RL_35y_Pfl2_P42]|uniref:hypothetical protein n=1 Tax=Pseudomonas sp. RL_35y_Pfl2_P42 TaxID=3088710 RepID=UPI0030DBDDB3
MRELVRGHETIKVAQATINDRYLEPLSLAGQPLHSHLGFGDSGSDTTKLKLILERLESGLLDKSAGLAKGSYGLGSNNLLFMACELLLLGKQPDGKTWYLFVIVQMYRRSFFLSLVKEVLCNIRV